MDDFADIRDQCEDFVENNDNIIDTNDMFRGELITIDKIPSEDNWKLIPLFNEGSQDELRVWQIGFDYNQQQLKIVHGILITSKNKAGENLQTSFHPIVVNKSGRNLQEQALLEARRRYINKYKEGYLPQGEELPADLDGTKPMLAKKWHHPSNQNKSKSNETKIKKYPVSVMRKIDGIRALARLKGNKIKMRSRLNNNFLYLDHIKNEIETFLKYLPPYCELDGELYSLDMTFEQLSSAVKTKLKKHERNIEVKYYIFDIIDPKRLAWEKRYAMLVEAFKRYLEDGNPAKHFKILQAYTAHSSHHIDEFHKAFVAEGYEGIMIRRYSFVEKDPKLSQYRSNRTNSLIKFKYFQDEEVTIIGSKEGTGTEDKAIIFIVKDDRGNIFPVRPRGTIEQRRKWYLEKDSFNGKQLTIRFQELTEKGVPRFPVGVCIRDYE